jgi:hypothetical protein
MKRINSRPIGDSTPSSTRPAVLYPPQRPRLLEFQIEASKLGSLVMNRLRAESICSGQEFQLAETGPTYVIDHIEFASPANLGADPNPPMGGPGELQLIVTVGVYLKEKEKLRNPATTLEFALTPSLDLYFNVSSNNGDLCIAFNTVNSAIPLSPEALSAITSALASVYFCSSLDLSALPQVLGDMTVTQAKVGSDPEFTVLSVRLALWDSHDAWNTFAAAPVHSFLNGMDWALLLDSDLVVGAFEQLVAGMILTRNDLSISQGPTGNWTSLAQVISQDNDKVFDGGITLTFSGDSWAALCDIGFGATIRAGLEVPSENSIRATIGFDVSPDFWDALLCFGPIGPLAVGAKTFTPSKKDIPAACSLVKNSLLVCNYPVSLAPMRLGTSVSFGTLTVGKYVATAAGPVLGGSLQVLQIGQAELSVSTPGAFTWAVHGDCGGFSVSAVAGLTLTGTGQPVKLCKPINVLGDTLNVFNSHMVINPPTATWLPVDVIFTFLPGDLPPDAMYWKNPYDLILLIESSAGCRTVSLGKVSTYTDQGIFSLSLKIPVLQANCDAPQTGLFGIPGKFDPHWLIDPGSETTVSYWEGLITGASRGDLFELTDESGVIVRSIANEAGNAQLNGVFSRNVFQVTRTETRISAERREQVQTSLPRLREQQTALIRKQEILLDGAITFLATDHLEGMPILITGTSFGLRIFDMSNRALPRIIGEAAEARGAIGAGTDLVYWGKRGMAFWSQQHGFDEPVLKCLRIGEYLATLTVDSLKLFDSALQLIGDVDLPNCGMMVTTRRNLIVVVPDGLALVDVRDPGRPSLVGVAQTGPVQALSLWAGPKSGGTVTAQIANEFLTLNAGQLPGIGSLATYRRRPWTFGAARGIGFWAKPEGNVGQIGIYDVGRSRRTYSS